MKLRNRIYFNIMHLSNKKGIFLLSALMLCIGFIVSFQVLCLYYAANYDVIQVHRLFGDRSSRLYKLNSGYQTPDFDFEYYEHCRDVLLELKKKYNIAIYIDTAIMPGGMDTDQKDEIRHLLQQDNAISDDIEAFLNIQMGMVPLLQIDEALLEAGNIRTEDGEICSLQIRADGTMEVAISPMYKGILSIGDTFSDVHGKNHYVVAAFLAEGQSWISSADLYGAKVISLDKYFVTAIDMEQYSDTDCMVYMNNIFLYTEPETAEAQVAEIEEYMSEEGVFFDILSFQEYEDRRIENNKNLYLFSLMLVILMLVTVLTVSTILSVITWMADYHDIGILYANGFLKRDLFLLIFQENMLKLVPALLISYAYVTLFYIGIDMSMVYVREVYLVIVLLYIVTMLLCSLGSYYFISRQVPVRLLKGEQI